MEEEEEEEEVIEKEESDEDVLGNTLIFYQASDLFFHSRIGSLHVN